MQWSGKVSQDGAPQAILTDKGNVVVKVYLSEDSKYIRFVLPEMTSTDCIKIDPINKLIDFKRNAA